jgi:hypothetical protein
MGTLLASRPAIASIAARLTRAAVPLAFIKIQLDVPRTDVLDLVSTAYRCVLELR